MRVWAIVPAAGLGRRMGRDKQVLPYRGSTLVSTVTSTLLDAGAHGVVVVTRSSLLDRLSLPDDPRVTVAINDDADSEMIDSIRIGLAELSVSATEPGAAASACDRSVGSPPDGTPSPFADRHSPSSSVGVLVVPGDMPALSVETCRTCIAEFSADPRRIVIATHNGRRGHPIIFPLSMCDVIDDLRAGLSELPKRHPDLVQAVEVPDPGATRDVDTQSDYDRLSREQTRPDNKDG